MKHLSERFSRVLLPAAAFLALVAWSSEASAQSNINQPERERFVTQLPKGDVSGGGRFFWVIFREIGEGEVEGVDWNREDAVVARGFMGYDGIDSIILSPQTTYRMFAVYADTLDFGYTVFTTPRAGATFTIPRMGFYAYGGPDQDADGLSDWAEFVVGSDDNDPDSDDDGLNDGAEVRQGLNPLDGLVSITGVIASAPTPGPAIDVCAINNLAVVACGSEGVAVFNVEASDAPTRIAIVDTPGFAQAVALFGAYIAVADGAAGVTVIDVSDPAAAVVRHSVSVGGEAFSVTTYGNFAVAGTTNGKIVVIDMITGREVSRYQRLGTSRVEDLGFLRDYLYVFQLGTLSVFRFIDGDLEYVRGVSAQGSLGAGIRRQRLFIGDDFAYTSFTNGHNIFSLTNPEQPSLVRRHTTNAFGWKQIISDGNGRALACAAPNSTADTNHSIYLYDDSNVATDTVFLTEFVTPGYAYAVALYNGFGFVADGENGLQVISYLAYDRGDVAPQLELLTNASGGAVEEGKFLRLTAAVSDDVQVRNVTFFVDGEPVATDGNFPYEVQVLMPLLASGVTGVDVRAEAVDTGGNLTATEPLLLDLVPDATPPRIVKMIPPSGSFTGSLNGLTAVTSEPIMVSSIRPQSVSLSEAGPDEVNGTADDVEITAVMRGYEETTRSLTIAHDGDLPPGRYRFKVSPPFADLAGNLIAKDFVASFMVFDFVDDDRDGVPDDVEPLLGLDPGNPDTDGDGILDGMEDFDNDRLPNAGDIALGLDPTDNDSDDNGVLDGNEDFDLDGLINGDEVRAGTDARRIDTDGDGIDDMSEIAEGLDPLDPNSRLAREVASYFVSYLNAIPGEPGEGVTISVFSPSVSYVNGIAETIDGTITVSVISPSVSYVNGIAETIDGTITVSVVSPPTSYVNGVLLTSEARLAITSAIVSFRNNL